MAALSPDDPCSFARPDECKVINLDLNLEVDFDSRKLCGYVDLAVERMKDGVQNLVKSLSLSLSLIILLNKQF